MKALSIKQPWASLICTPREDNPALGIKDIENRTWKTNFRGRIYVHASQKKAIVYPAILPCNPLLVAEILTRKEITSAIIGEVDIVDCVLNHESIWAEKSQTAKPVPENYSHNDYMSTDKYEKDMKKWKKNGRVFPIYNWVLANPVLYEKPIPCKGKLSFWEPDFDIVECIGCDQKFNIEEMSQDDAGEDYCPECWQHFKPLLKAEYDG